MIQLHYHLAFVGDDVYTFAGDLPYTKGVVVRTIEGAYVELEKKTEEFNIGKVNSKYWDAKVIEENDALPQMFWDDMFKKDRKEIEDREIYRSTQELISEMVAKLNL